MHLFARSYLPQLARWIVITLWPDVVSSNYLSYYKKTYTIGESIESFHWIIALTFVVRYFNLNFSKSLPIVQKTLRKDVAHTKSGDAGTAS